MKTYKIAVAQLGARKHYQEPSLIHDLGMLETLFTDFYIGNNWVINSLNKFSISEHSPVTLKRALERYDTLLEGARVVHFPIFSYKYARSLKKLNSQDAAAAYISGGKKVKSM